MRALPGLFAVLAAIAVGSCHSRTDVRVEAAENKIAALEAQVAALEEERGDVDKLEARVAALETRGDLTEQIAALAARLDALEGLDSEPDAEGELGIPECDEYMEKMWACLDKLPAQARDAAKSAWAQSKDAWIEAASTEEGRRALAETCRTAMEAAASSYKAMGCEF